MVDPNSVDEILENPSHTSLLFEKGEVWPPRSKHGDLGVLRYAERHSDQWHDRGDWYWMWRLFLEVCEAIGVLLGAHSDPLDHKLRQIGSICHNWLDRRTPDTKVRMKPTRLKLDEDRPV